MIVSVDVAAIADAAYAEAAPLPKCSPERRAASHLWVALTVPPARSVAAARRAILSFGDETTQSDALALLGRIAARLASERTATA